MGAKRWPEIVADSCNHITGDDPVIMTHQTWRCVIDLSGRAGGVRQRVVELSYSLPKWLVAW